MFYTPSQTNWNFVRDIISQLRFFSTLMVLETSTKTRAFRGSSLYRRSKDGCKNWPLSVLGFVKAIWMRCVTEWFLSSLDYYLNHCPDQVWFIGIQTGLGSPRKKLNCKNTSYRHSQRRWTQLWGRSTGSTHCIYCSVEGRPTWSGRFLGSFWNRFYQWPGIDLLSKDANACQPMQCRYQCNNTTHYALFSW